MGEYVLRTLQLTKQYGAQQVLGQVDLSIRRGSIYGFIGQNGAGKSTLMRIVSGLAAPTSGTIELFGEQEGRRIRQARSRIGLMIERPALFPAMTAAENLEVQRLQKGVANPQAAARAMELVGLEGTGRKPAGDFSLGMKQRLDLAVALLGLPELLILDEPTNGLDPMSVIELRELLRRLNREEGITILISSHILSELHLLATDYGIIHHGKLLEELAAEQLNQKCRQYLHIKAGPAEQAVHVLRTQLEGAEHDIEPQADGSIRVYNCTLPPAQLAGLLVHEGLALEQFMPMGDQLEDYYVKRIAGDEG